MLLRDSSGVLMVLALVVLLASQAAPAPAAENGADESFPSGGGVPFPTGTLDLLRPTPEITLAPGETPRPTIDVTKATLPPWCANPTCTVFVTPSPSPKPTKKPTPVPTAAPTPCPTPDPLATPCPTATPIPTPVPSPSLSPPPPPPTPDTTPPSAPTGLGAEATSCTVIALTWTASPEADVTGYSIYDVSSSTPVASTAGTSYNHTGLNASTQYVYEVRAYDAAGNLSSPSSTASATTPAC